MKYHFAIRYLVFGLVVCLSLTAIVRAQEKAVRFEGEIVAFDRFNSLLNVTHVPPTQLFLMKISRVVKGKENANYIFVKQRNYDDETSLLKAINAGKYRFTMNLTREPDCDSSLKGLDKIRIAGRVENSKDFPRIEWLRSDLNIPVDVRFPCYALNGKDFIVQQKSQ